MKLLLVIIDTVLAASQQMAVTEWLQQVNEERQFEVVMVGAPRVGIQDAERHNRVQEIRAEIARVKPAAVLLMGGVAVSISGWHNPDGHGARALATDVPYMFETSYQFRDSQNWGTNRVSPNPQNAVWNNLPGDGKWDEITLPISLYRRPVSRIFDFTQLPYGYVGTISSGCHAGEPRLPAISETVAIRDYLDRNMAYRTGRWVPPKSGMLHGAELFWPSTARTYNAGRMTQFAWSWSQTPTLDAIPRSLWWFGNSHNTEDWWRLDDASCDRVQAVWWQTYKSFGMEWFISGAGAKRWQRNGLVVTWGRANWFVPPTAVTISDAIDASIRTQANVQMINFVMGDLTLPTKPLDAPPAWNPVPPKNLKVK